MRTMTLNRALAGLLAVGVLGTAAAGEVDERTRQRVQEQLRTVFPEGDVDAVRSSVVPGLLEVVRDTRLYYVSEDGNFLIAGQVIDTRDGTNVTRARSQKLVADKVNGLDKDRTIAFGPDDAAHRLTVFTDVDCPYCRKFHQDVAELNEAGVQVRYLLFPRTGLDGESYRKSVGVWCSDDPNKWIGVAKAGGEVAYTECENPELGRAIGIRGTPTIVLDDGQMIGGYLPPDRLLAEIEQASAN